MQIAINGRDFTSDDGPHFAYYPPPIVSSLSPASGPLLGGTRVLVRAHGLSRTLALALTPSLTPDPNPNPNHKPNPNPSLNT